MGNISGNNHSFRYNVNSYLSTQWYARRSNFDVSMQVYLCISVICVDKRDSYVEVGRVGIEVSNSGGSPVCFSSFVLWFLLVLHNTTTRMLKNCHDENCSTSEHLYPNSEEYMASQDLQLVSWRCIGDLGMSPSNTLMIRSGLRYLVYHGNNFCSNDQGLV